MGGSSRPLPMPIDGEKPTVSEANGAQRTSDKLKPSEASLEGANYAALDLTESHTSFDLLRQRPAHAWADLSTGRPLNCLMVGISLLVSPLPIQSRQNV